MLSFPPLRKPHEFQRRSTTVVFHIPRGEQIKVLRSNQFEIFVSSCRFEISASGGKRENSRTKTKFWEVKSFSPSWLCICVERKGGLFRHFPIPGHFPTKQNGKRWNRSFEFLHDQFDFFSFNSLLGKHPVGLSKKRLTKQRDRPSNVCLLQLTFR